MPLLRLELSQTRLDKAELPFALLDQLGRFDETSIDALALGCDLVEVGLQLLAAAFVGLEAAAVGLQPLAGLVGGESLRRRGLRHCHHERGKQPPVHQGLQRVRDVLGQCAP